MRTYLLVKEDDGSIDRGTVYASFPTRKEAEAALARLDSGVRCVIQEVVER